MKGVLHLAADAVVAIASTVSGRTRGFSEREAAAYLSRQGQPSFACQECTGPCDICEPSSSAAAGGEAAASDATHAGHPSVGVGRAPDEKTSALLFAAANQLELWQRRVHFDHWREEYLAELVPDLRTRAHEFASQDD